VGLASYVLLLVLTALVTVWGAVLTMLRIGGVPVPLGLLLAVAIGPLCWAGGNRVGARIGTAGPGLVWALLVLPLLTTRPEGDLVITGSARGVTYLALGALSAAVAIGGWTRPRASPAPPDSREPSRGGLVAR
jgi:hypothetical protein